MSVRDEMRNFRRPTPSGGLPAANVRVLTPKEFVALSVQERGRVVKVEAIPPKIGRPGFGHIRITTR